MCMIYCGYDLKISYNVWFINNDKFLQIYYCQEVENIVMWFVLILKFGITFFLPYCDETHIQVNVRSLF